MNAFRFLRRRSQPAFTVVELIVVIVVIGLLATLATVGYGTWRKSVAQSEVKSDLSQLSSAMTQTKNFSSGSTSGYPILAIGSIFNGSGDTAKIFTSSKNVLLTYVSGDKNGYCVQADSTAVDGITYHLDTTSSSNTTATSGTCQEGSEAILPGGDGDGGGDGSGDGGNGGGGTSDSGSHSQLVVGTLSGSVAGFADGNSTTAKFDSPYGVAVDTNGNVYVGDLGNNRIRKISSSGNVTTLAGNSTADYVNGTGSAARFWGPTDIAVDASNNLFVVEYIPGHVRKITPSGTVTTFAGQRDWGYVDGPNLSAKFDSEYGIAVDANGTVYVGDTFNGKLRKISGGQVTTIAIPGEYGSSGSPAGIAVAPDGTLYVACYARMLKITTAGVVTSLAGDGSAGFADGTGSAAKFNGLTDVALAADGSLYVTDQLNNRIRNITPNGVVTTIAGSGDMSFSDGAALTAGFNHPSGIAIGSDGTIYVGDPYNNRIRTIKEVEG